MLILCVLKISCGIYVFVYVLVSVFVKPMAVHYSCAPDDGCLTSETC
jgi:hypothetical protein